MTEETGVFPNERTGVIVTPVTKVKEQVNCSSLPAMVVSLPLVVVIVVVSEIIYRILSSYTDINYGILSRNHKQII